MKSRLSCDWIELTSRSELENKRIVVKWVDNDEITVVLNGGSIQAFSNVCPHKGGPLSEGRWLDGLRVRCPWHGYVFDLSTGQCMNRANLALRRYRWVERDGKIFVSPGEGEQ